MAGLRRHRANAGPAAGLAGDRTTDAGELRRRPAHRRRPRRARAIAARRLAAQPRATAPEASHGGHGQGDGPALPVATHHGGPLRAGPDRRSAGADRPRVAGRRFERTPQPRALRRTARHRRGGAARAKRHGAPARQPERRDRHRPGPLRRRAEHVGPDRVGAHRCAALPAAGGRRARQARPRGAAGDAAAGLQLIGQSDGAGLGRGPGTRRDGGQRALFRDHPAEHPDRAAGHRRDLSRHRHHRGVRTALPGAAAVGQGRTAGHDAGLPQRARAGRRRAATPVRLARQQLLAAPDGDRCRPRRRPVPARVLRAGARRPRQLGQPGARAGHDHAGGRPPAFPLRRTARARRIGGAAAPAGADREAGAPADPRQVVATRFRPHAVPVDGAARLQGRRPPARPGGAGGRQHHGQPAVGTDAGRRPDPSRRRQAPAGAAHRGGPPVVVDRVPPLGATGDRAHRAGRRQPVGGRLRGGIPVDWPEADRRPAGAGRCAAGGRGRGHAARRHGLPGRAGDRRRSTGQQRARGAVPPAVAHPAHLGPRHLRPAARRRPAAQRRGAVGRVARHRGRDRRDGGGARVRVPQLLPPRAGRLRPGGQQARRQRGARADRHRRALRGGGRLGGERRVRPAVRTDPVPATAAAPAELRRRHVPGAAGGLGSQPRRHHLGRLPGLWRPGLAGRTPCRRQRWRWRRRHVRVAE